MTPREHDPRRLDVAAFATEGASLSGTWPLATLARLAETRLQAADGAQLAGADELVHWQAQGEARPILGGATEIWLSLSGRVALPLECQRCLGPVLTPVDFERRFRFVGGEEQAAALDAESEDDVLAMSRSLDLAELVEDELLLALPLIPRHEPDCPAPVNLVFEAEESEDAGADGGSDPATAPARENPFAALAALKKKPGGTA